MKELWQRLRWHLRRGQFDRELDEEMRHHLALKAEYLGSTAAANRQFGNLTLWRENSRAMWTWTFWQQLTQDLRYGLRTMGSNKLFTAMAVLSLALGIGANTAIYSFMDAIMIRAIPVDHPEQLAIVKYRAPLNSAVITGQSGSSYGEPGGAITSPNYPYPAYEFLRDNNHVFSTLFAYANAGRLNLIIDSQAELAEGQYVSGGYFTGLGVRPAIGRLISPDDDRPGVTPVVSISYGLWQRRFSGSPDVLGKSLFINGKPFSIIGVTEPEFFGVNPSGAPQVFVPVRDLPLIDPNRYGDATSRFIDGHFYWVEMMGRLKPGATLSQAQVELGVQFRQWVSSTASNKKERATLPSLFLLEGGSGVDSLRHQYSKPLFILMTMVGLILLIACANIANLLLARSAARRREIAVRLSLGAGRARVIQQLLTESLLLSLWGALIGIAVAALGIRALTSLLANGNEKFTLHAQIDGRILLFTLLVALGTGLLFGLAPALQATRIDITPALKETRSGNRTGRSRRFGLPFGLSHVLVVTQIAISLLLVAAAGLFVRTLGNLHSVDIGFNRENLLIFNLNPGQAGYKMADSNNLYDRLLRRLRVLPGVINATMSHQPLVANWTSTTNVTIPGRPKVAGERMNTAWVQIAPDFFATMQIPVLLGRAIDQRDRQGAQPVAVVNEVFAKKYFPSGSPVGRHFGFSSGKDAVDMEIVGVAKAARYSSLKNDIPPVAYLSYLQADKTRQMGWMYFEIRTRADALALASSVRQIVHEESPQVPVAELNTQAHRIDETIVQERMFADLCSCFGVLALVMACVGLYGTMAYGVSRRTGEIGIRMALGAARSGIVWMVLREVLALGAIGLVLGLFAVWETTAYLKSLLFGLTPADPLTLLSAVATLITCALVAGFAPALRASRIDPMSALRDE